MTIFKFGTSKKCHLVVNPGNVRFLFPPEINDDEQHLVRTSIASEDLERVPVTSNVKKDDNDNTSDPVEALGYHITTIFFYVTSLVIALSTIFAIE